MPIANQQGSSDVIEINDIVVAERDSTAPILDDWIRDRLGQEGVLPSKSALYSMYRSKKIFVNRQAVRGGAQRLRPGDRVEFEWKASRSENDLEFSDSWIVYQDEWIVVVNKPAKLPVQPTLDPNRPNLFSMLEDRFGYVGLHHRIDAETSGLIIFTLNKEANAGMAKLFEEHAIQKIYQALVSPPVRGSGSWKVDNFLGRTKKKGKTQLYGAVKKDGKSATTQFRLLRATGWGSLIEAKPLTGRTHQIRVHLAAAGSPILGDRLYGSKRDASRVMLHASALTFDHPIQDNRISLDCPAPKDFVECLKKTHR